MTSAPLGSIAMSSSGSSQISNMLSPTSSRRRSRICCPVVAIGEPGQTEASPDLVEVDPDRSTPRTAASRDVGLLDEDRVGRAPPFRGAGGVFPGSGVQGFPSRARVGLPGFLPGFSPGFVPGFRPARARKVSEPDRPLLRNPGHDWTLLGRNCPIVTALCSETPVRIGLFPAVSVRSWPPFPQPRAGSQREPQRPARLPTRPVAARPPAAPRAAGHGRGRVADCARIAHDPHVRVPAAAGAADELELGPTRAAPSRARRYVLSAMPAAAHSCSVDRSRTSPSASATAAIVASSSRSGPRARL